MFLAHVVYVATQARTGHRVLDYRTRACLGEVGKHTAVIGRALINTSLCMNISLKRNTLVHILHGANENSTPRGSNIRLILETGRSSCT